MDDINVSENVSRALTKASAIALNTSMESIRLSLRTTAKGIPDETIKLKVTDLTGRSLAFILWSSAAAPGMVARGIARARAAREALGADLDRVPLGPLLEGALEDRTFAVMPIMIPLSTNRLRTYFQRKRMAPSLLRWLQEATIRSQRDLSGEERKEGFGRPLEYLNLMEAVPVALRKRAEVALERLSDGRWSPKSVLMHGDLWTGNILIDPRQLDRDWNERFVLIDWGSAAIQGYAIYDLIRLAISFRLPDSIFRSALSRHVEVLHCDPTDTMSYLLAALGHIGLHIEHFPLQRFVELSSTCTQYLDERISSSASPRKFLPALR